MKNSYLKFWKNPCQLIYMIMAALLAAGGINVFSASYITASDMFGSGFHYLLRYLLFTVLGLFVMYLVRKLGYRRLLHPGLLWTGCIIIALMLLYVDFFGVAAKGASRWLYLGPFSLQPSEFAKLAVIMLASYYLGDRLDRGRRISLFAPGSHRFLEILTIIYAILVYAQPDLGTAAIIAALMLGMYIIAGIPSWEIFLIAAAGCAGAVAGVLAHPYRLDRIKVWFDPWLDEMGDGYQMVQSLLAIGSGGLTGTNWGHGAGKFFYLPESHTDFAFAIFCQENGFFGALLLTLLFVLLGFAFCTIAFNSRSRQGFLLASGVTLLIIGQAAANMGMVCGLLPVIGVPLTFISYGGSSMLLSMGAIGLLLSVYDEEAMQAGQEALPPEERRSSLRVVGNGRRRL